MKLKPNSPHYEGCGADEDPDGETLCVCSLMEADRDGRPCAKEACGQPLQAHVGWALRHLYAEPPCNPQEGDDGPPLIGPLTGYDLYLAHHYGAPPQGPQNVRGVDGAQEGA